MSDETPTQRAERLVVVRDGGVAVCGYWTSAFGPEVARAIVAALVTEIGAAHKAGVEAGVVAGADLQRNLDTVALKHATRLAAEQMRDAIARRLDVLAARSTWPDVRERYALAAEDVRSLPATYGIDGVEHGT